MHCCLGLLALVEAVELSACAPARFFVSQSVDADSKHPQSHAMLSMLLWLLVWVAVAG